MDSNLMVTPPASEHILAPEFIEEATEARILHLLRCGARLDQVIATRESDKRFTLTVKVQNRPSMVLCLTRGGVRHFYTPSAVLSWVLRQLPDCSLLQIQLEPPPAR